MFFIDIAVPRDVDPEMNELDGIFVYDIDDLYQVAASHMEERSRQAVDAEALIAAEVERFHLRQRTVNVAPAIVALQKKAEEIRVAEIERIHNRLGPLSPEQLHPPMQAIKQAARDGDESRLEALCDEWSVSTAAPAEAQPVGAAAAKAEPETPNAENPESKRVINMRVGMGARR
jgi:glutamyl-tRNA reductase